MKGEGKREFGWMVKEGRMVREIVKEKDKMDNLL